MSRTIFLAMLLMLHLSVRGADTFDTLTIGSTTYKNVVIIGFNVTDVYFKHDGGIANARLRHLQPELQKKFHYNATVAERAEAEQAAQNASFGEVLAKADLKEMERKKAANAGPPVEAEILDPLGPESFLGKKAPPLDAKGWVTEKPETEDKFLLIFVWSSTSTACTRAVTQLNKIAKVFHDKLVVIAVSKESANTLEELKEPKLDFPSASDPNGKFAKDLGITAIPCAVLIDSRGLIRYLGHPDALNETALKALLVKFAAK